MSNPIGSSTADHIAWAYYTSPHNRSASVDSALRRVTFQSTSSAKALHEAVKSADACLSTERLWRPLLIVTGRGRRGGAIDHSNELARMFTENSRDPNIGAELRKTVGDTTAGLMLGGGSCKSASFLVMEACSTA